MVQIASAQPRQVPSTILPCLSRPSSTPSTTSFLRLLSLSPCATLGVSLDDASSTRMRLSGLAALRPSCSQAQRHDNARGRALRGFDVKSALPFRLEWTHERKPSLWFGMCCPWCAQTRRLCPVCALKCLGQTRRHGSGRKRGVVVGVGEVVWCWELKL